MSDLVGKEGEIRMVVHITRKESGVTETHELVGYVTDVVEQKETDSGSDSFDSGAECRNRRRNGAHQHERKSGV